MDFWARIIAPLASAGSGKDASRDPVRRRQRFEKEYSQLLQIWRNCSNLSRDVDAAENLEIRLQELTNILGDESRRPLPHPCIAFCATKQIYIPIAKIATTSYNEWIIKEAVLFFATLIESEEESFVENDAFSASLTNLLVRITGANSIRLGSETEIRVVELAFNITTKIRLEPSILSTWFKSHQHENESQEGKLRDEHEKFAGRTQKQDFPLFYLLMDYIHSEGKVGDFARTGLLYIIESASSSVDLEQWIVESDLSTLMATGLGALYSQLSRKLVIDHDPQSLPPVLALSDYQHPTSTFEINSSCSDDFQLHLETFLSHLLFWQDVLNHCRSGEVKSTLLEHFQVIFLQQLLYPSLLESSDVDGGSSVAVLTYLRRILEALDHPDMINLILHYLLALPNPESVAPPLAEPAVSAARKRKSMDLATMMATKVDTSFSPLLFNLVDLIQSSLKSQNQQTVCVTLQLLAAILKRHHRYAVITLIHTQVVLSPESRRTWGAHEQEVEFLTTLAGSIGGQDNFDEIYDSILKDTMSRLESHPCSLKLVAPKTSPHNQKLPAVPDSLPGAPRDVPPHTLNPADPLLNTIIDLLEAFFINSIETNLSLTEAIIDLAICGYTSVEGWLLRNPGRYTYDEDEDSPLSPNIDLTGLSTEMSKLQAMANCRRRPQWQTSTLPRMLQVLETLTTQVSSFRDSIPRFEDLLQQRREAFQTADTASSASKPLPPQPSSKSATPVPGDRAGSEDARSASPAPRPRGLEGFAQRLLSELGTPNRSQSPRGRKDPASTRSSGMSGGYGIATPTSKPAPSADTPTPTSTHLESPGPGRLGRSFSPSSRSSGGGGAGAGRDSPVASQVAAFAAVDQSILARRYGIPPASGERVKPIPLSLVRKDKGGDSGEGGDDKKEEEGTTTGEVQAVEQTSEQKPEQEQGPEQELGQGQKEGDKGRKEEAEDSMVTPLQTETETETETPTPAAEKEKAASVSHILTNIVIFQSFLLELAGMVQVRAGLFNEVRFV